MMPNWLLKKGTVMTSPAKGGGHPKPADRRKRQGQHRGDAVQGAPLARVILHGGEGKGQPIGRKERDDAVLVVVILQVVIPVENTRKGIPCCKGQPHPIDAIGAVIPAQEADAQHAKDERGHIALHDRMPTLIGQQIQKHYQRQGRAPSATAPATAPVRQARTHCVPSYPSRQGISSTVYHIPTAPGNEAAP